MTPGQQKAFDRSWQTWGLKYSEKQLDKASLFANPGPLILEIGFGMGQSLAEMAAAEPGSQFIGVEVHRPGVGRLLHSIEQLGLSNIHIYCHDAVEVLQHCIPDASLDRVQIYFPDPWHKKRHHKRRLIQAPFIDELTAKLKPGGLLHLATDWENYAEQMLAVMEQANGWHNTVEAGQFVSRPDFRPLTKFEKRGQRLGHGVWDLLFERSTQAPGMAS